MPEPRNGHMSLGKQAALVSGILTFIIMASDALNGFQGLAAAFPLATKGYVDRAVETAYEKTAATEKDIQDRLVNLQMMSLEMSLQLIDGQLGARRGEMVDIQAKLLEQGADNNGLLHKRQAEVQANIDELLARRELIVCYLDTLRGLKRNCK